MKSLPIKNLLKTKPDQDLSTPTTSTLAPKLQDLKTRTVQAAAKREHLPQPLFWSLFHSQVNEIKQEKAQARALAKIFSGIE